MEDYLELNLPPWADRTIADGSDVERLRLYHEIVHRYEPYTAPKDQDKLRRTAAEICKI